MDAPTTLALHRSTTSKYSPKLRSRLGRCAPGANFACWRHHLRHLCAARKQMLKTTNVNSHCECAHEQGKGGTTALRARLIPARSVVRIMRSIITLPRVQRA